MRSSTSPRRFPGELRMVTERNKEGIPIRREKVCQHGVVKESSGSSENSVSFNVAWNEIG